MCVCVCVCVEGEGSGGAWFRFLSLVSLVFIKMSQLQRGKGGLRGKVGVRGSVDCKSSFTLTLHCQILFSQT